MGSRNSRAGSALVRCPAVLAWVLLVALAGCVAVDTPAEQMPHERFLTVEADANADPDPASEPDRRLTLDLSRTMPPADWVERVPSRPNAIGRLDVPLQRTWKYIVIHHSFTPSGNEAIFDRCHKQRGWLGVGYHFVIGNGRGSGDGGVEVTFRWEQQIHGAHAGVKEYNEHGIGICLVGDFQNGYPTDRQMASLAALVNYLQGRCSIPTANILLHRHIKNTSCPGRNFPFYDFISLLEH